MTDDEVGITIGRVDAGADGGAAQVHLAQEIGEFAEPFDVLADRHREGAELGAKPHRHGVHELGTADLDDVVELSGLHEEGVFEERLRLDEFRTAPQDGEADRCGVDVVG